jgi:hypothetical protein
MHTGSFPVAARRAAVDCGFYAFGAALAEAARALKFDFAFTMAFPLHDRRVP